jgi:hypothetical protein
MPERKYTTVVTQSGSRYTIIEDGSQFFLSADNVPNPYSEKLVGEWEIVRPYQWPPVLGERLILDTPYFSDYDNPLRLPGGGKRTSRLVEIIEGGA